MRTFDPKSGDYQDVTPPTDNVIDNETDTRDVNDAPVPEKKSTWMELLRKYWWVVLIIVIVAYMMFKKKNP